MNHRGTEGTEAKVAQENRVSGATGGERLPMMALCVRRVSA